jgi:hypothetical protein
LNLKRASRDIVNTRSYVHGDPVRMIDWKAFARTDQLLVREVRDEAAVRIAIAVSLAETMFWPTPEVADAARLPRVVTKAESAVRCALNLAYAHLQVGDFVRIYVGPDGVRDLPLVWAPRSTGEVVGHFEVMRQNAFRREVILRAFLAERSAPSACEVAYAISDELNNDRSQDFLSRGRKSALIHVLSALEQSTDWLMDRWTYFDPAGPGHEFQKDDLVQGQSYLSAVGRWQNRVAEAQKRAGTLYIPVNERTKLVSYAAQLGLLEELR